jgi:IMP dehydrogenase
MVLARDAFFESVEQQGIALTFNDVRLDTHASMVATDEVDLTSNFSRNIETKVPLVSAAMDTVTTADMAIVMAKIGGLGVIHAGLDPEQQGKEVRKVKHELNGLIHKPITFKDDSTLGEVLETCSRRGFDFRTFPIVDEDEQFVGLLTQNDFDFSLGDNNVLVRDAMTPAKEVVTGEDSFTPKDAFECMKIYKKKPCLSLPRMVPLQECMFSQMW